MSSEISTNQVRVPASAKATAGPPKLSEGGKPDTTTERSGRHEAATERSVRLQADPGLQPWHFFVLGTLGCLTAVTFLVRGQGLTRVALVTLLMATAGLIGAAALRALRPLVSPEDDRTAMIGHRTRVALEREKALALRSIKELEFDRAMGRLSDADWNEMSSRLRARAARLIKQLDAGADYRAQIERDLEKRLGDARLKPSRSGDADTGTATALAERTCASCATVYDPDARFCKSCGAKL